MPGPVFKKKQKGGFRMEDLSTIVALFAERRYFCRIMNSIVYMAEEEKNLSLRFMQYLKAMQMKMDNLYLDASHAYHEVKESCVMQGTEPEVLFAEELNHVIKQIEKENCEYFKRSEEMNNHVQKGGR